MGTWIRIYALLSRKHTSRDSCVFGVKFWTQIFVCVKKLTLSNSASMQVLYNCSWFTIWRFILDLRTFVAKSALSRLRALGGSFWPKHFNGPGAPHPCPLPSFIAWNGDLQQQRWGQNVDHLEIDEKALKMFSRQKRKSWANIFLGWNSIENLFARNTWMTDYVLE